MEIQGLSEAQNIHYQHGAPHSTGLSPLRTTTGLLSYTISNEIDLLESHDLPNDNNNYRPKTSPFGLLAENGSGDCLPIISKQIGNVKNNTQQSNHSTNVGFHNVITLKEKELNAQLPAQECLRNSSKYDVESEDNILQMALPFFEGEEEHSQQPQLQSPVLRQQHEDGASLQHLLASESTAAPGSFNTASADKNTEELYVVFNIVQEDGINGTNKDRTGTLSTEDYFKGNPGLSKTSLNNVNSMEIECNNASDSNSLSSGGLRQSLPVAMTNTKQNVSVHYETHRNAVLTNEDVIKTPDKVCTEIINGVPPRELPHAQAKDSSALIAGNAGITEGVEMCEHMDTSDFVPVTAGLPESSNADAASTSVPVDETFSGTIMINNQSIIVTIENGILTLAAPPEGYVHKEDDMVSLKEHLGMKDHEDIVLLNYDSGTKSIGKISTLAVSSQQEDGRPGLFMSDTELAHVEDCALSDLGVSLDSCPVIKQEGGTLCAITEGDLVIPCSKQTTTDCDNFQCVNLIRATGMSKKGTVVTFGCPQPNCPGTFDTRQKLKVHLLNHQEDPRPFQCTFEGCGWAFTTSYKLKRHLQSHDKVRPHTCQFEGCGRRFTTVYNLKAHVKVHDQENAFVCEICSERFRSATRLANHQRVHFEPQRPYKCEFPGCEKTFITFSALFSHNRTHFRETGQFFCTYPGCDKCYDKACRLKIHMRSHTGERPFVCDSEGCAWSFTSMSKLLRHKRKHDDDRRFTCPEEGCGKSFTRAEHLKGHSITHLGTKPFECHVEGCSAKFSARSSLYIHSKKHKQDASTLRTRCPMANCSKHFSSRSSLKSHMLKHHHLSPDVLSQLETTPSLTPSNELISHTPTMVAGPGVAGAEQLTNLDLGSLFSAVPGGPVPSAGINVGVAVGGSCPAATYTMDLALVSSGILTIDPSSVGTGGKAGDPLILAGGDMGAHHGLEGTVSNVLPPQGTLNLDDVQTVTPEALGTLTALSMQGAAAAVEHALSHPLGSSSVSDPTPPASSMSSLTGPPVAELLSSPPKAPEVGAGRAGSGPLLGCVEVLGQPEGGKVLTQFVFPGHSSSFSPQKDMELNAMSPCSFLDTGGSARTDYRAIQLAKKRKQRGPAAFSGSSGLGQRKNKGMKAGGASTSLASSNARFGEGTTTSNGGLTLRDPVTGAQYVQIQLLQDDPASDGDLPFQLSSQPSSSHSQLTVDLPVNILQEPSAMTEDDNGSDNSQFTGSTINLQDLE